MNKRRELALRKDMGKQLRKARKLAGLAQRAAARLLKESPSFVAESETARRRVLAVDLPGFVRVYRQPMSFFFEPFDEP